MSEITTADLISRAKQMCMSIYDEGELALMEQMVNRLESLERELAAAKYDAFKKHCDTISEDEWEKKYPYTW